MNKLRIDGSNVPIVRVLCIDYTKQKVYVIRQDDGFHGVDEAGFDNIYLEDTSKSRHDALLEYQKYAYLTINSDGELQ